MNKLGFAFKQDVGQRERRGGESKTIKPVCEHRRVGEITIGPELIQQRVVTPVLITDVV